MVPFEDGFWYNEFKHLDYTDVANTPVTRAECGGEEGGRGIGLNSIRLHSIEELFDYPTVDFVRLAPRFGEFDYVRLPNSIQINRTTEFD